MSIARVARMLRMAAWLGGSLVAFLVPFASPLLSVAAVLGVSACLVGFLTTAFAVWPGETEPSPGRRKAALAVASSLGVLALVFLVSTLVSGARARPPEAWRAGMPVVAQLSEPELGWAPFGPPEVVGQRLQRVDPARRRVLLLGDSIVYGMGLSDEDEPGRRLAEAMPSHQILNAAVSGYSVDQYALMLERTAPVVRPEAVVVGVFTGNDYELTGREIVWGTAKPLFRPAGDGLERADRAGRCINRLSRSLLFSLLWREKAAALAAIEAACDPARLSRSELHTVLGRLFDRVDRTAASVGAKVLWVLLPVNGSLDFPDHPVFRDGRHVDLARLLRKPGREVFDFSEDIYRPEIDRRAHYLPDNGHLSAVGAKLFASAVARELSSRGLVAAP